MQEQLSARRRLAPPRSLTQTLYRPGLTERIHEGLRRQVVVLLAPPGFGKTEALRTCYQALSGRNEAVAWLSLTTRTPAGALEAEIAEALGSGHTGLGAVLDEIATRPGNTYLFIDKMEAIGGDDNANLFARLFAQMPDNMRLALAGRAMPNVPLSRLRVRGLVTEIGAGELTFSRSEMRLLLGSRLAPAEFERAAETLAGWPALTRLALVMLERSDDARTREAVLEASGAMLRDFVFEEILPVLAGDIRHFLIATLGLGTFTLEIAAQLADMPLDPDLLRRLETLQPVILTEDRQPGWYRLLPAVKEALKQLNASEPLDVTRVRHARAAALFVERGLLEKAVLHASLAGDYDLAVQTIEEQGGVNLFLRAGYTVLRDMVEALPVGLVQKVPSLRLCRALMLAKQGDVLKARGALAALGQEAARDPALEIANETVTHISSLIDVYEDRGIPLDELAAMEAATAPRQQDNTWMLGWVHNHLTIAYTRRGDLGRAHENALKALTCYQEERTSYPQAFMLIHLSFVSLTANRIDAALTFGRRAEHLIQSRQWSDANLIAIGRVPLAGALYVLGEVDNALRLIEPAMATMAEGEGWVDFFVRGYGVLARALLLRNGIDAAREAADAALAVADWRGLGRLRLSMTLLNIELLTRAGDLASAAPLVASLPPLDTPDAWPTAREWHEASLAVSRFALREGRVEEAAGALRALAADCRAAGNHAILLRAALMLTEAHWRLGDDAAALAALEEAAVLSLPGRQIQQFIDEGEPLAEAVRALVRRTGVSRLGKATSEYLGRTGGAKNRDQRGTRTDFLSVREAEILGLLAEGLTNKAIARHLDISEATVKFHLKNLYAKLGVARRTLAVSVARASGILG